MTYVNMVQQLGLLFESMDIEIDDKVLVLAILNGLSIEFKNSIIMIDSLVDESSAFTLNVVLSSLLRGEQRRHMRNVLTIKSALFGPTNRHALSTASDDNYACSYCHKRGHTHICCWNKHHFLKLKSIQTRYKNTWRHSFVSELLLKLEKTCAHNLVCLFEINRDEKDLKGTSSLKHELFYWHRSSIPYYWENRILRMNFWTDTCRRLRTLVTL